MGELGRTALYDVSSPLMARTTVERIRHPGVGNGSNLQVHDANSNVQFILAK